MTKNEKPLTGRRLAREVAFQFLYGNLPEPGTSVAILRPSEFDAFCQSFDQKVEDFAWELVEGTGKNLPSIDEAIKKQSTNWRIERMPRVDLTVLRLACYEIMFRPDIPKTVSINEAVEIAKRFGAEDSPSFVNGLLDKFEKTAN